MTWQRLKIGAPFLVVATLFSALGFVFGLAGCGGSQADQRAQTLALVTAAASCATKIDPSASSAENARRVIACVVETSRAATETCRPAEVDAGRHAVDDEATEGEGSSAVDVGTVDVLGF